VRYESVQAIKRYGGLPVFIISSGVLMKVERVQRENVIGCLL
jgi:hypothetical protein